MNLKSKKDIATKILKAGRKRVWFNPEKLSDIKEAITKEDLKGLMKEGSIRIKQKEGQSRGRARKILEQKKKGRQQGTGSRKGRASARTAQKPEWMARIRSQRMLIKELLEKGSIQRETYRFLRKKSKGGFFRNKGHIKVYLTEHKMWIERHGK